MHWIASLSRWCTVWAHFWGWQAVDLKSVVKNWSAHTFMTLPNCLLTLKNFVLVVLSLFIWVIETRWHMIKLLYWCTSILFLCVVILMCSELTPHLNVPRGYCGAVSHCMRVPVFYTSHTVSGVSRNNLCWPKSSDIILYRYLSDCRSKGQNHCL